MTIPKQAVVALVILVVCGSAGPMAAQATAKVEHSPRATIADFAWIVGHWEGTGLGGVSEEMWMPPAGGAIVGSFRQLKDGAVVFYELLAFLERQGTVVLRLKHFNADLTGWEEKAEVLEFRLVELTPTMAVFDAMTFARQGHDAFQVVLRMRNRQAGTVREEVFQFRRARSSR